MRRARSLTSNVWSEQRDASCSRRDPGVIELARSETPAKDETHEREPELDRRQTRVLGLLLAGFHVSTVAKKTGVGRSTIFRWLRHDEAFKDALRAGQRQSLGELSRSLAAFDQLAVATLADLARDKKIPPATRRAAANQLLQRRIQVAMVADLEDRLSMLEDAEGDIDDGWDGPR